MPAQAQANLSESEKQVRTRVAPSPTGFPHIGTVYQALFDYAYAKRYGGQFIVRLEDTDQSRSVEGAEKAIYDALDWMGLTEDESSRRGGPYGPYKQSERLALYATYAHELVRKGHAYHCFCTKDRLEEVRRVCMAEKRPPMYDGHCRNLSSEEVQEKIAAGVEGVIRMKIPRDTRIVCNDGIRGDVVFESHVIDDQVLLKSDGFPTYHLAVVVDDHLMEISHIVRGEEWLSSFPKHTLLYTWFGWKMPPVYHTPILRNPDKSKMSKRHGHTALTWYMEEGILPEALRNFLALMGWAHEGDEEIIPFDRFIKTFDVASIRAVGPIFDMAKLYWMNGEYIRMLDEVDAVERIQRYTQTYQSGRYSEDIIRKTVPLVHTRLKTLKDYDAYCRFFVDAPEEYEKSLNGESEIITATMHALEKIHDTQWTAAHIGDALVACADEHNAPHGRFFMTARVALTGKKVTPPLNESMEILGKEECIDRLRRCITTLSGGAPMQE